MKKAYFIDLDNTIYFTKPNTALLLGPIYKLLENEDLGISDKDFLMAKEEMLSTPFQKVAQKYNFNKNATAKAIEFLKTQTVNAPLKVHGEYHYIKNLKGIKFIVTAGFTKLQLSKIKMLGIADDFEAVKVVDFTLSSDTKKEVFEQLLLANKLIKKDVLIIGDDANAEIKYGQELGIDTFLFDPSGKFGDVPTTYHSKTLKDLENI